MYIFKQATVTGVYITMFIKWVLTICAVMHERKNLTRLLVFSGIVFYSSLFYLPQYFQVALGYSAVRSGVFLLPMLVSQTLASFISVSVFTSF